MQVISIRKILSRTWSTSGSLTLLIKSSAESLHQVKRVSLKAQGETLSPTDVSEMDDWRQTTAVSQSVSQNGSLCFKKMGCERGQWKDGLHLPKRILVLQLF